MLARFDGKCYQCGGVIRGSQDHSDHEAHQITWARRTKAGEAPAHKKWVHVSPSCSEVASGILLRAEERDGATASVTPDPIAAEVEATVAEVESETTSAPSTASVAAEVLAALRASGVAIPEAAAKALTTKAAALPKRKMTSGAWYEIFKALLASAVRRVLLVGPPGTGKSTTAQLVDGAKTYRITMTEGTGVEDVLGMFQLVADNKGTKTQWVDGPATLAMREGARLQIDEGTHCPAEMQSLMYGLMDDDPQIMLPNGEHLKAAAGYTVVMTTNDNPQELPDALMSRCEAILLATVPHPDSLKDCGAGMKAACLNYYRGMDLTPWKFSRSPAVREVRSFSRIQAAGYLSDELIAAAVFGEAGREFLSTITTSASAPRTATARPGRWTT